MRNFADATYDQYLYAGRANIRQKKIIASVEKGFMQSILAVAGWYYFRQVCLLQSEA